MAYSVRIAVFEGPLDLLLHLIRSHKLEIRDIPIAQVTEQYLEYLALMESLDLDIAGEFLVMAATLMEIKSRMLLPRPAPVTEEDPGQDPRAELVARLLEYERFQQVAEQLREMAGEASRSFQRPVAEQWEGAVPLVELTPGDLLGALKLTPGDLLGALKRLLPEERNGENGSARPPSLRVRREAVNLRQRIGEVLRRVQAQDGPLPFSALLYHSGRRLPRVEVLVTFLAILELVRQGQLAAWQQATCGEILLTLRQAGDAEPAAA